MNLRWMVGTKLGMAFAVVLTVFLVVGVISYRSTLGLIEASDWRKHTYEVLRQLDGVQSLLLEAELGQRTYLVTGEDRELQRYRAAVGRIAPALQAFRSSIRDNPQQLRRIDALEPLVSNRLALAQEAIDLRRARGPEAAAESLKNGRGLTLSADIDQALTELRGEEEKLLQDRVAAAETLGRTTRWTILVGTGTAIALAVIAAVLLTRAIARPLGQITRIAERITVGDLQVSVPDTGRGDEVGILSRTFDRMTHSLQGVAAAAERIAGGDLRSTVTPQSPHDTLGNAFAAMTGNLREQTKHLLDGASVLGAAASQIVASTAQLAASASESAAAVSQTTTTVEEVRQTAQMATHKAQHVAESAQKAAQVSEAGRRATEDAVVAMRRIRQQMEAIGASMARLSEQGQTIGQIIATVEDVASQSNLLAVNAAIEAAKAGEHGKGFGVVAQEVKNLADQSRQATSEVRTVLGEIQKATASAVLATEQGAKAVEAGILQSDAAGEAIVGLAGNVSEAAQAAVQIAASSQQQLVGVDQVAAAMNSISQASAQNVSSAKQLEGAARNLNDLGRRLKEMVERYQV